MKYLVLGPGAMALFAILGHVSTLNLSQVKEISGSSAGSILGFLLCLGMSPVDILDATLNIDVEKIYKMSTISCLLKDYGMISTQSVRQALLECSYGRDPTFNELDKVLYVSTFCMNTQKTVYFSKYTHPNMKVIDAVCMSVAVPIIFASVTYDGYTYVDGCIEEKLPMGPFLDKIPEDIYAIEIGQDESDIKTEIKSIKDFALSFLGIIFKNRHDCYVKNKKTIKITTGDALNFTMSHDEKLRMYSRGFS